MVIVNTFVAELPPIGRISKVVTGGSGGSAGGDISLGWCGCWVFGIFNMVSEKRLRGRMKFLGERVQREKALRREIEIVRRESAREIDALLQTCKNV